MSVELHLPDLPEVPISLGPAAGARRPRAQPLGLRLRDGLSTYLPLLLMALLALSTWWLVKHTPGLPAAPTAGPVRQTPDSTMHGFTIERFDRSGRLRVRVDGRQLRHYPDTGRYEIDDARIQAIASDGRQTRALAARAVANSDLSELQLHGGARVSSQDARGRPLEMRSEFLHAFLVTERVQTDQPVVVTAGADELHAAGLAYDHGKGLLELKGRQSVRLAPVARRGS